MINLLFLCINTSFQMGKTPSQAYHQEVRWYCKKSSAQISRKIKINQVALTGAVLQLPPLVQALDPLWQSPRSLPSQSGSLPSPCTPCTTCTPSTTCTPAPPHCPSAPTHPLSTGSTPAAHKRLPPPRDPQDPHRGRPLPRAGKVFDNFADDNIL